MAPATTPARPVGRPRAVPSATAGDAREEILEAAAALFTAFGYTATTTRAIAERVGLRQASLFHYFAKKDDLLQELLARTVRPALAVAAALERAGRDGSDPGADAAVWALARRDVANLCRGRHNLGALQLLPEVRAERFAPFWDDRRCLLDG